MAIEGNRISLITALTFAQRRAQKACFKQFRIAFKCTEILTIVHYVLALYKYDKVGLTVVLNCAGIGAAQRNRFKRYMYGLAADGYLNIVPYGQGESVNITGLGQQVIDFYEQQFYAILQAGETKYKKRLKYGYLPELPIKQPDNKGK